MSRIAYFDCFSGCAGDMCLGALVDAGLEPRRLTETIAGLGLGRDFDLRFERVRRGSLAATRAIVEVRGHGADRHVHEPQADGPHTHRCLAGVIESIAAAGLPPAVAARSEAVFRTLALAEAAVHGQKVEDVQLHEVGAIDAIIDICATVAGLELLGVAEVYASEAVVGRGSIRSEHGELPAPGPAVLAMLAGRPLRARDVRHELTTPTGAALLTTLAGPRFGPIPPMSLVATGTGAGTADFPGHANVLRVLIGEAPSAPAERGAPERCVVLEANLDDTTPQVMAAAVEALIAAGALDAFTIPCLMKKGRPGHLLTALVRDEDVARLERVIFRETTTFGVRRHAAERTVLAREIVRIATEHGEVEVKLGRLDPAASGAGSPVVTATPEYESARRLAEAKGLPVRVILEAARAAALRWTGGTGGTAGAGAGGQC